jgi:DNA polymerase III subunit alpha
MTRIPKKFVSIHNHCTFSAMDGLGYPDDHFKWCIENGLDAHAITDHGNMNCYAHAQLWVEDYNKKNDVKFKYIPGVEGYFHPDLSQWEKDKELHERSKGDKKLVRKLQAKQEVQTKLIIKSDTDEDIEDIEMANQLTIEDEDATKSNKHFNPINRRHHLVVLPKNSTGLIEIFGLISKSYLKNFYRFPRFDAKDLANVAKNGNIITSSACIGSQIAWSIFQLLQGIDFDKLDQSLLNDNALLDKCVNEVGNYFELLENTTGKGNNYLELQFNKLPAQNLVNRAILEFAKRNGLNNKLVVTCDAHYYNPDVWKERELYKKLGFMNYKTIDSNSLPKSKDDLKCELYPKNATQLWETYLQVKNSTNFYDDEVICDAIERTYDIAHNLIEEVKPDRSPKFPTKLLVPEDTTSFKHLVKLCKEGLVKRGLDGKQAYVDRLKYELSVLKQLNNADYFITYQKIVDLARGVGLVGCVRGSGGGSLINYVLYITDLDPIEWNLPFERFISVYRKGAPDIDTDVSDRDKVLDELRKFFGFENVVPISNYNTFKVKTLLKDIGKFYGIAFEETNAATLTVDQDVRKATTVQGEDKNLFVLTYDGAMEHSPSFRSFIEKYPNVGESMKILFKQNRALSRHAGGTIICDDLPSKAPLIVSGGEPQFPFVEGVNYKHCEYIGNYIKQDLLGLATLRLIERTIELILKDKLYEICIEDKKYRFPFNTKIKLEDGTCEEVQNLNYNHNVKMPIEIEK